MNSLPSDNRVNNLICLVKGHMKCVSYIGCLNRETTENHCRNCGLEISKWGHNANEDAKGS